jgi:uncharacterized membrane protein
MRFVRLRQDSSLKKEGFDMDKINNFFKTSLLGGTVILLPIALLAFAFVWIFHFITGIIQPLTNLVLKRLLLPEITADILVVVIIILACFAIGVLVKTKFGGFIFHTIEHRILKVAPGYSLIKEMVVQLLGQKESPFSKVALARIFQNETLVSCFITDRHRDGSYTLFVPTGPNPTSGMIYHVKGEYVHPVKVSVEEAMRSIISCGAGSQRLMNEYLAEKES